jgi:TRAP-type C4-dicarboxylate transport system substrate-binding protein
MKLKVFVALFVSLIMIASILSFTACSKTNTTTATVTATTTTAPAAKQVLIRMTTPIPPGDVFITWAQEGLDKFNARTNGAYKIQLFPGAELAPFPESMDAIRTGAVEAGMIPLAAFAGSVPEFGLAELPFLFNNDEANAYAANTIKEVYDGLAVAKANQKVLGCFTVGTLNILSKKPVKTLEDLKGLIVGCDAPPMTELIKALGGSGIVVDFTEDYSNLQKGVIDAKTSAPQYIDVAKLYEVAKYYCVFHGIGTLYSFTINSDVYNKMSQDIKDALNQEMTDLAQTLSQNNIAQYNKLIPELADKGLQIYFLPPTERDRWKALSYPATLDQLNKAGDIGAEIKAAADAANQKYPYEAK